MCFLCDKTLRKSCFLPVNSQCRAMRGALFHPWKTTHEGPRRKKPLVTLAFPFSCLPLDSCINSGLLSHLPRWLWCGTSTHISQESTQLSGHSLFLQKRCNTPAQSGLHIHPNKHIHFSDTVSCFPLISLVFVDVYYWQIHLLLPLWPLFFFFASRI